jgi:RHS repeat-associated protein
VTERYAYDADGRRVRREHAGGTTVYAAGGLWEETIGGARRSVYTLQGRTVAQRDGATGQVLWLHGDHLGSVSVVTDQQGQVVSRQQYDPWGAPRGGEGIGEDRTTLDFTGQRRDATGLLYYGARYYDPQVGRFLSPDTIVPGMAAGSGGGAATLGHDEKVAHTLSVGFHKPGFVAELGAEHRFILTRGFWFQLDEDARQEAKVPWGPVDPQALNRYAYVLNNPLRYVDPTGHVPWLIIVGIAVILIEGGLSIADAYFTVQTLLDPYASDQDKFIAAGLFVAGLAGPGGGSAAMRRIAAVGRAGERLAGITRNTERIVSRTGTAAYRVPDGLSHGDKLIQEVKNVRYLRYTDQLQDFVLYAKERGYRFELFVRRDTQLSDDLQAAVERGDIVLRRELP